MFQNLFFVTKSSLFRARRGATRKEYSESISRRGNEATAETVRMSYFFLLKYPNRRKQKKDDIGSGIGNREPE
jgi:hypothetical protein